MANEESGQVQRESVARRRNNTNSGLIIVIIVVAMIIFLTVNARNNGSDRPSTTGASTFKSTAVLSGIDRRNRSEAFRGGSATAVLGGISLDLRDALMEGDEATIEISALMGGVDIRVPRSWTVVNRVGAVLAGVDDHTRPSGDSNKRLIIEGTVLLSGLDIKN